MVQQNGSFFNGRSEEDTISDYKKHVGVIADSYIPPGSKKGVVMHVLEDFHPIPCAEGFHLLERKTKSAIVRNVLTSLGKVNRTDIGGTAVCIVDRGSTTDSSSLLYDLEKGDEVAAYTFLKSVHGFAPQLLSQAGWVFLEGFPAMFIHTKSGNTIIDLTDVG